MRESTADGTKNVEARIQLRDDMSAKEIIFEVLKDLKKNFDLAPSNSCIPCYDQMYNPILDSIRTKNIIRKLAEEYGAIRLVNPWERMFCLTAPFVCSIQKTDKFDYVYDQLSKELLPLQASPTKTVKLTYTKTNYLLLNDCILIAHTRYDSINDRVIRFLVDHPNETFSRADFEMRRVLKTEEKEDKDFFVILNDLNLRGDLRKLFFGVDLSSNSIHFRNPVDLEYINTATGYIDVSALIRRNSNK